MTSASIPASVLYNGSQVASVLPPTAELPEPRRVVGFFRAFLFFWLVPKRYGPHLAAGSFKRALAAHVLALVLVFALIAAVRLWGGSGHELQIKNMRQLRIAVATWVITTAARGMTGGNDLGEVVLACAFIEPAILFLAVLLMPWCAGGDRAWSVFKRSLNNVYWSTTFCVPATILIIWPAALLEDSAFWEELWRQQEMLVLISLLLFFLVVVAILARMLLAGAARYVGPADGPAFAPREPKCDACGYLIIGLPLESNCPECNLPVRESLPGGRRGDFDWVRCKRPIASALALLRNQWRVLWDRDFFVRIPVHSGAAAARHFWWATLALLLLVVLTIIAFSAGVGGPGRRGLVSPAESIPYAILIPLQTLMAFAACLWGQWRHGIKDYRSSVIVCYYGTPLMWPAVLLLTGGLIVNDKVNSTATVSLAGADWSAFAVVLLATALLFLMGLAFWWMRLCRGLRAVRYANV